MKEKARLRRSKRQSRRFSARTSGTNGEYDVRKAFEKAGASVFELVFRSLTADDIKNSIEDTVQAIKRCQS